VFKQVSLLDASTRTMFFVSLYIISNRLCFLRSCKVVHSNCSIMLLTDPRTDTSAKYLGFTISSDLKWGKHIRTICSKANNTISFLKRNINISNKSIKEKAYVSLVIISNRLCFLRSCKVVHSNCSIMLLTDEVLWYRLVAYRAALLWTISNRWMPLCWYGSHTELAYSKLYCLCPESWILQGSAPSLNLNDTVFICTVYKFHFIASKYVQVLMRTSKKLQNPCELWSCM
jgi:hypothetical protein